MTIFPSGSFKSHLRNPKNSLDLFRGYFLPLPFSLNSFERILEVIGNKNLLRRVLLLALLVICECAKVFSVELLAAKAFSF